MAPRLTELPSSRLFVRGHTRHVDTEAMGQCLLDHGIRTVINVARIRDQPMSVWCDQNHIAYWYSPMSDASRINTGQVQRLVRLTVAAMQRGGVLVHCDSGWNRSNLIAILACATVTKQPVARILELARQRRPKTLKNPVFEAYVLAQNGGSA